MPYSDDVISASSTELSTEIVNNFETLVNRASYTLFREAARAFCAKSGLTRRSTFSARMSL